MLCHAPSCVGRRRGLLGLTPPQPRLVFQAETGRTHIGRALRALRGMVIVQRWRNVNVVLIIQRDEPTFHDEIGVARIRETSTGYDVSF